MKQLKKETTTNLLSDVFLYSDYFFQFGSKEGYLTKLGGKVKVRSSFNNS